jgi:hypothetical protein
MHQLVERHTRCINFLHEVPHGVTFDQVRENAYWANAWKRFQGKEMSTVDFIAEDGSWEAQVRIVRVTEGKVEFRVLHEWKEEAAISEVPKGYRVEFISENGWRAFDPNNALVIDKQAQRNWALEAALDHATAAAPKRQKSAA